MCRDFAQSPSNHSLSLPNTNFFLLMGSLPNGCIKINCRIFSGQISYLWSWREREKKNPCETPCDAQLLQHRHHSVVQSARLSSLLLSVTSMKTIIMSLLWLCDIVLIMSLLPIDGTQLIKGRAAAAALPGHIFISWCLYPIDFTVIKLYWS